MHASLAKDLGHEIRATVHHGRLCCEAINAVHEAHDFDDSLHAIEVTELGCVRRERESERAER